MMHGVVGKIRIVALAFEPGLTSELEAELDGQFDLTCASSLEAARARLASAPLADVALIGERDAVAVANELSAAQPGLAIIVVAAVPESRDLTAALNARHIAAAVQRPWRRGELGAAVRRSCELGELRREVTNLNGRMHRRLDALAATLELASALAEVESYQQLAQVLAHSMFRVLRCRLTAVGLAAGASGVIELAIHCHEPCGEMLLRTARDRCLGALRLLTSRSIDEAQLDVIITGDRLPEASSDSSSFTHVAIRDRGAVVGVVLLDSAAPSLSTDDEKLFAFVAARAADAYHQLGIRLLDERRRLSLMVDSMADGLILTDASSDHVLINPAARRMFGIESEGLVTTQYLKERLGFYPFDLVAARPTSSESSEPLREELRIGDQLLHSIVSPVRDAAGKLVGVVVVLRDISEARELARRQSDFVSVISHELRTPLTSIAGALDIVLAGHAGKVATKQDRYLRMARDAAGRLNIIIDDLLEIARTDRGQMPVHFTPLSLDALSREVIERFRAASQAKNIRLRVRSDGDGEDIRIVGDADRLTQVLSNLLSNALKFTPLGGNIDVEIFGPSIASDHVGVSVFNNGESIPEEARERVFDRFEQLEASSSRRVGGTGLGLAISRAIVEAHGGRIWVESSEAGTKFVFTLPVAPEQEDEPSEVDAESRRAPTIEGGSLVLVVDDDAYSSYILKGILMAAGHDAVIAEDADTALSLARQRRPALIVINNAMGVIDGGALLEIFKHDPDTRRTATVLVVSAAERSGLSRTGATEVVEKPLQPQAFRELCNRVIAEAGRAHAHRVLVVDDDRSIRLICREVLESAGFAVRDADCGAAALAEAKRFRPDLLLLDVMMPDMDGFTTAERFRAEAASAMTPIIFLSARGETADKVRAFRSGAEDYIVKPFDAAELVARVSKALERHARELGASPTTQLPGADAIEAEIVRRLAGDGDDAFCYLDLDNLKAFNDYYGYAKADGVIRQTADLLRDVVAREGSSADFIGHIAGDDFVFITAAEHADRVCRAVCSSFDRLVPLYYNKTDREHGFIETNDRYGVLRKFPIMSVSIASVTRDVSAIGSYSDLAEVAARGKKLAKEAVGSSYVRDGRIVLGETPSERAAGGEPARL